MKKYTPKRFLAGLFSLLLYPSIACDTLPNDLSNSKHKPEGEARNELNAAMFLRSFQCTGRYDEGALGVLLARIDCGPDKLCDGDLVRACVNTILLRPCPDPGMTFYAGLPFSRNLDCVGGLVEDDFPLEERSLREL